MLGSDGNEKEERNRSCSIETVEWQDIKERVSIAEDLYHDAVSPEFSNNEINRL